ncbi:Uncharacterised protein [Fluoribacter dumoffii]|uniref:Uncharacterized protein n=1 Tax=Fluoribacter dumoffii TaxID=463 RepID=A0A377IW30_9GAMM|nr:Uncharacterised protein [Fluoribacter dumoffii]
MFNNIGTFRVILSDTCSIHLDTFRVLYTDIKEVPYKLPIEIPI